MNFKGENGEWVCLAKVKEEENQFIFYSLYPQAVPQDKRLAIAKRMPEGLSLVYPFYLAPRE